MRPKFYKRVLENGATVLFEHRKSSGIVSVAFAIKHGGIHEDLSEKGISHFIEHMLYKGTKNRTSKKISEEIEKRGGILNGFTEEEMTAYWCKMPSKHLDVALEVLSDMLKNSVFDKNELEKERKVIFEEMKMRKDTPQIYVYDKIQSLLYEGNLAYDIIGTEESMNSINQKKIIEKFNENYGTNNMVICVVGDADFETICKFVQNNFKKKIVEVKQPKIFFKNQTIIEKKKGIDQVNMIFAFHSPNAVSKKSYAAQVLSTIMAGGMSSRLFQEIREKRNLAYAVKGNCHIGRLFGYTSIYIGTQKENLEAVKKIIIEEFAKIQELSDKELEEAKEQIVGNSRISREDSQGQMLDLLYNEIYGDAKNSYKFEKEILKVKKEDLKKIADFKNYSLLALIPE
jgi:predicted Zn-dependent peptidase